MSRRVHVKVPARAKQGEIIRLMTKLNHPMESGWRHLQNGKAVAKDLVGQFVCRFDGVEIFRAEFDAGTAGNPYLSFYVRAEKSGSYRFSWIGKDGEDYHATAAIEVV